ncbi:TVP38/TMEM64 family membrane protein slr0305 isoform X2 [Jatropha curcas]|uniref:TVP38/TMEM64 family membrane protein slr0305 isoform X2 n=1 Tax=Jatropha curcas TaxID=180498 RepID=UPI0005FB4B09|nr:TVP38/TMEM64 family membrane protein slr0305 isoform X2 [Jatropha curcas]
MAVLSLTRGSAFRFVLLLLLLAAGFTAFISLPIEKLLKDLLLWIKHDLGPWGPLVLAAVYIPLTILAVPASVLTLGGGYLFGLPVGFVADSIGATIGATAAFLVGRTIGRSYVMSKLKNYPKFEAVAIAVRKSGFKPITFALVYMGTTLKDLSDVTHGWNEVSTTRWIFMALGFVISAIMMVCVAKVAKASLDKALADYAEMEGTIADSQLDINEPLVIKIDPMNEENEK